MGNEGDRGVSGQPHTLIAASPTSVPRGGGESGTVQGFDPVEPRAATTTPSKPLLPITKGKVQKRTVKEGETLYSLTEEVYGDGNLWSRLKDFNTGKIKADGSVREGVTLTFPPKDVLSGKAMLADETGTAGRQPRNGTPMPESRPTPLGKPERTGAIVRGEPTAPPARNANTYTIQKGDALSTIAQKKLGSSKRWQELVDANPGVLDDPDSIPVGAVIKIPASSGGGAHDSQR
jgi:nucleoid-associated protein YgaU